MDDVLPRYDVVSTHDLRIAAPARSVFAALEEVTPAEIRFFRPLMGLRHLRSRSRAQHPTGESVPGPVSLYRQMLERGFVVLAEQADQEIVVGAIAKFWRPRGERATVTDRRQFVAFAHPGYAKAAVSFFIESLPGENAVILTTETRVQATDASARRRFSAYWLLIGPASALLRTMMLRAVKTRAESGPRPAQFDVASGADAFA